MQSSASSSSTLLEKMATTQKYAEARVIVLNDEINTFDHVAISLKRIIPGMSEQLAWKLTNKIDREGMAEVWRGPLEQAELYHAQLGSEGLTMAPIEKC